MDTSRRRLRASIDERRFDTVSELLAPAAGTIESVNAALDGTPESVNQDPYGEGWMISLRLDDEAALDKLMSAEEYRGRVGEG